MSNKRFLKYEKLFPAPYDSFFVTANFDCKFPDMSLFKDEKGNKYVYWDGNTNSSYPPQRLYIFPERYKNTVEEILTKAGCTVRIGRNSDPDSDTDT